MRPLSAPLVQVASTTAFDSASESWRASNERSAVTPFDGSRRFHWKYVSRYAPSLSAGAGAEVAGSAGVDCARAGVVETATTTIAKMPAVRTIMFLLMKRAAAARSQD